MDQDQSDTELTEHEPDTTTIEEPEAPAAEPDTAAVDTAEPDTAAVDTAEPDTAAVDTAEPGVATTPEPEAASGTGTGTGTETDDETVIETGTAGTGAASTSAGSDAAVVPDAEAVAEPQADGVAATTPQADPSNAEPATTEPATTETATTETAETETAETADGERVEAAPAATGRRRGRASAPAGAPKAAAEHANSGLTGIAEDLEALKREAGAETPSPTAEDGEQEGETRPARGRGRGRGRGKGNANGQQGQTGQQGAEQVAATEAEPAAEPERPQQERSGGTGTSTGGDGERRGRYRDRKRRGGGQDDFEPEIGEDDVLIPIAGILDVLDNYAFVRTSGYLPGPHDVYVSLAQVKKYALRKGDAIVGAIRQREGDGGGRQKYNALVKIDTVNGLPTAESEERVEFAKLTPLYPQERLRLETEPSKLGARLIDLVAPVGKGQRGLIVSPPRAGKTVVLQSIANGIAKNNPEAHLMVVLVDERPEEVTEMQRSVKGEVIASTFDRPAEDHTTVAELAIERAKRLVELGYDVVVLLDSITRLARAYNQTTPASGRVLSGGVEPAALWAPKRFFGAARNVENGGSLTILATALVETGSATDEAVFQEFKDTGNMELRLSGELADKRIFPAVDVTASGTRREEMLLGPDEVKVTWQLRRSFADVDEQTALERLLDGLARTATNVEFLVTAAKSLPAADAVPAR